METTDKSAKRKTSEERAEGREEVRYQKWVVEDAKSADEIDKAAVAADAATAAASKAEALASAARESLAMARRTHSAAVIGGADKGARRALRDAILDCEEESESAEHAAKLAASKADEATRTHSSAVESRRSAQLRYGVDAGVLCLERAALFRTKAANAEAEAQKIFDREIAPLQTAWVRSGIFGSVPDGIIADLQALEILRLKRNGKAPPEVGSREWQAWAFQNGRLSGGGNTFSSVEVGGSQIYKSAAVADVPAGRSPAVFNPHQGTAAHGAHAAQQARAAAQGIDIGDSSGLDARALRRVARDVRASVTGRRDS